MPEKGFRSNSASALLEGTGVPFVLYAIGTFIICLNNLLYGTGILVETQLAFRVLSMVLFLVSLAFNIRNLRLTLPWIVVIGLVSVTVLLRGSSSLNFLAILLFCLCSSSFDLAKVLKTLLAVALICFAFYFLFTAMGMVHWVISTYATRTRNTLGFYHVNAAAVFFAAAFLLPLTLKKYRLRIILVCFLFSVAIFFVTDTRGLLVFGALFLLLGLVFRIAFSKLKSTASKVVIPFAILYGSIVFSYLFPFIGGSRLDVLLSYRLSIFSDVLTSLDFLEVLFGSGVAPEIDNSYIVLLATYGAFFLILIVVFIHRAITQLINQENWCWLAFICSMLLYGVIESLLFRPELLITLAFWAIVFSNQKELSNLKVKDSVEITEDYTSSPTCHGKQNTTQYSAGMRSNG